MRDRFSEARRRPSWAAPIKLAASLARMPAQLSALSDHLGNLERSCFATYKDLSWLLAQLQAPRVVTVLLLGECLDDDRRRPIFASVNVRVPTGESSSARGLLQLQLPVAAGAWLVAVGGLVSAARVGVYAADAAQSAPSPIVRLGEPITVGVAVQFTVHRAEEFGLQQTR